MASVLQFAALSLILRLPRLPAAFFFFLISVSPAAWTFSLSFASDQSIWIATNVWSAIGLALGSHFVVFSNKALHIDGELK
jgi:hypothetical protein